MANNGLMIDIFDISDNKKTYKRSISAFSETYFRTKQNLKSFVKEGNVIIIYDQR